MSIKITIITATYNSIATLRQTMDAVALQTFAPHEYIIIDGGSTDGTVEFAKAHGAATHVISEPDEGIADAFNKGIALATGDWIGIINSDDWYEENAFSQVEKYCENADIIHGNLQFWQDDKPKEVFVPQQDKLHLEMTINHPTVFVKKELYTKYGLFDLSYKYAMDYELILRFLKHNCNFVNTHTVLANMRYGGASDVHWCAAYSEAAQAKKQHLGNVAQANIYLFWQIIRGFSRRFLQKMGLEKLVKMYRKKFSVVKKT